MRQKAIALNVGAMVFVHGSLKSQVERTKDDKIRSMYHILSSKLIVKQERAVIASADESQI